MTHRNGLLQRRAYLFPSDTTDMDNGHPLFSLPQLLNLWTAAYSWDEQAYGPEGDPGENLDYIETPSEAKHPFRVP